MTRHVAFLRAINVGDHTIKMADLRRSFEDLGFGDVQTFIASGNVAFDTDETAATLERRIERALEDEFGYRVDTFVRTARDLAAIAAHRPFDGVDEKANDWRLFVVFTGRKVSSDIVAVLRERSTGIDAFEARGRELYWLVKGRYSDSIFSGALLEKVLGAPATVRGAATVRNVAAKVG